MKLSKRDLLGWKTAAVIYPLFLCLFLPFLVYGLVYFLNQDYTLARQQGATDALAISAVRTGLSTDDQILDSVTSLSAQNVFGVLSVPNLDPESMIFVLAVQIATNVGGYVSLLYSDLDKDNFDQAVIFTRVVSNFATPMYVTFAGKVAIANAANATVIEKALIVGEIQLLWKNMFLTKFGSAENMLRQLSDLVCKSAFHGLEQSDTFPEFYTHSRPISNATVLDEVMNLAYGLALLQSYGTSSVELFSVHTDPYSKQFIDANRHVNNACSMPLNVFSCLILIIVSGLVFLYRREPEIRSKYNVFLISLFSCLFVGNLAFMALNAVVASNIVNIDVILTSLISVVASIFPLFLSCLICRHHMMFRLFVCDERKPFFFFPMLWQLPMAIGLFIITFLTYSHNIITGLTLKHCYSATLAFMLYFGCASLFYIYKTRKAWDMFVDTHHNVRTLFAICLVAFPVLLVTIIVMQPKDRIITGLVFSFYYSFITASYLLDTFLLPIMKVSFRQRGKSNLGSIEFKAQCDVNDISALLEDKMLNALLLDFASQKHCEENVYFLIGYQLLKNEKTIDQFNNLYAEHCVSDSKYELNLNASTSQRARAGYDRVQQKYNNNNDGDGSFVSDNDIVFTFDLVEYEILRLVRENLLKEFKQSSEVQSILQDKSDKTKVASRLASLGLVTTQQSQTLDTLKDNESSFVESSSSIIEV